MGRRKIKRKTLLKDRKYGQNIKTKTIGKFKEVNAQNYIMRRGHKGKMYLKTGNENVRVKRNKGR